MSEDATPCRGQHSHCFECEDVLREEHATLTARVRELEAEVAQARLAGARAMQEAAAQAVNECAYPNTWDHVGAKTDVVQMIRALDAEALARSAQEADRG